MKQESHSRVRSASSPARSVVSSTVVQKHVGQTIVQLPQVRQRSATSSQRGCSGLRVAAGRGCPSMSSVAAHLARARRSTTALGAPARRLGAAARCGSVGEHLGAALAADLDEEAVAVVVEQLGQREVEAAGRARARCPSRRRSTCRRRARS